MLDTKAWTLSFPGRGASDGSCKYGNEIKLHDREKFMFRMSES